MICPPCPAGHYCSSGGNYGCTGTTGARHYFGNTFGSCTTASAGNFAPNSYFDQKPVLDYVYTAAGASTFSYTSAGYYRSSTSAQSQCGTAQQSGLYAGYCSYAPVGYYVGGSNGQAISMAPLPVGYYLQSQTWASPSPCPFDDSCTATTATGCDAMKYSNYGWSYCTRLPIGYYSTGSALTTCPSTLYNVKTSTCGTCTYSKCDLLTGLVMKCPIGQYFASATTQACSTCTAGYYCSDGVYRTETTDAYPNTNTGSPYRIPCAPGYTCTKTTITQIKSNWNGFYSLYAVSTKTEQQYIMETDLYVSNIAGNCPSDSYKVNPRIRCELTKLGKKSTSNKNSENDCATGSISWYGTACSALNQNEDYNFPSDEVAIYSQVHCPTGWYAYIPFAGTDFVCSFQTPSASISVDYVRGVDATCPMGQVAMAGWNTPSSVTYQHNLQTPNPNGQCQDCPVNLVCWTHSLYTGTSYCAGKQAYLRFYDENNSNLKVQMDDRRVSQWENQYCFDCNHETFSDGICAFASDYYPDHSRSYGDDVALSAMILKCPFQSMTRTQQRYLDTIQWQRLDSTSWSYHTMQAASYTYDTYAWFDDTEPNRYPYSMCNIDETYFTHAQIASSSEFLDQSEKTTDDCTLYEYLSPNFPSCVPNFSGFISDVNVNQPTETAVPNGYYTQLTQNEDYTGIVLKECPEFTEALMVEGGVNAYHTCHIKDLGSCKDSTSDYCNNGQDFMCPDGFNLRTGITYTNTINDCESCSAGSVCSASTTATTCPDGYNCEAMTDDVYSKPGQPGELLVRDSSGLNNDITDCTGGFCEGATYSGNLGTCPAGYHMQYTAGQSDTGQHSMAACYPTDAGTNGDPATACTAGNYCPAGSSSETVIPPGFFSASASMTSINDLTVCPAGSWCDFGSTASTTQCPAGSYCEAGTVWKYDTPCDFGSTSSAGGTSSSSCSACTDGNFCQQGSETPLTDGSYCGNDNFLCIGGTIERTECADGQFTTDGATCGACPAGKFCTPGLAATDCSAGYESAGSLSQCALSTPGQVTTGGSATANAAAGSWTIAGQTAEFNCPPGYHCNAGVKTECAVSEVCAEGSSAAATAATGTVGDETGLFYDKPCPAGYTCPASTARSLVSAGQYTIQGDDGSTPSYCDSGYSCPVGSIGPMQTPCADGTYYVTGTASDSCPACATGSYCYQAQQIACEPGMYCDIATDPANHKQCPLGTYSVAGSDNAACTECNGGYACNQRGMTAQSTFLMSAGYFGITGATSTQPERIPGVGTDSYQCDPFLYDTTNTGTLASLDMGAGNNPCNQGICPQGYYCEEGSAWPTVCPAGKYNLNYREVSVDGCIDCIDGYYCPDPLTITQCQPGTVCPAGSPDDSNLPAAGYYSETQYPIHIPCEAGTFQASTGQSSCDPCTAGSQCPVTGMSVVDTCDKGSDCSQSGVIVPKQCYYGQYLDPTNAINPNCVDCPEDKFCWYDAIIDSEIQAESVVENSLLRAGQCPSGYKCVAGAYIPGMNVEYSVNPNAYICREGKFCDNTLIPVEQDCPAGYYMPRTGAESQADCLQCKPGYECINAGTVTPTDCPSGMYCVIQTDTSVDQCQAGYYCPTNAETAFDCAYGSYAASAGMTSCTDAAAGYYQDQKTQSAQVDCPVGYFCELGQVTPMPCPAGQTSVLNTQAQADCTDVPIGEWRQSPSTNGIVTDGYAAPTAGEYYAIPTRFGYVCERGHFCQGGIQTQCVAGTKCWKEGLTVNSDGSDDCDAGYYCLAGTTRERPTSIANYNGNICQPGGYCVTGSTQVADCPIGTYSDAYGLNTVAECHKCKNGYYCPNTGMLHADLVDCPAGSYCIESIDSTANAGICGYGKKCPLGSLEEIPCEKGYYQDQQGQSSCIQCDSPNYCPFKYTLDAGLTSQRYTCDAGHKCEDNGMSAPTPCPVGYFQAATGQTTCDKCTAGYYCPLQGTVTPLACPDQFYCPEGSIFPTLCVDGQICDDVSTNKQVYTACPAGYYCRAGIANNCWPGYVCTGGATTPTPNSNDGTGYICPAGYHCDDGLNETPCITGYYNENYGASSINNCLICPSGTECLGTGNTNYKTITCPAGNICDGATVTPCSAGYYCPSGTLNMLKCLAGQYTAATGSTSCTACPESTYCPNTATVTPTDCPDGFYCPEGTANYQIFPCPIGTYHNTADGPLGSQDECTECMATFYCPRVAMTDADLATYPCGDGYICDTGSYTITGTDTCGQNQYCIAGVPSFCPTGYYSPATGLPDSSECVACSPGKVCVIDTVTADVNIWDCPAGFYCPGKIVADADATQCPVGHYCPTGTGEPIMCEPGYYQDQVQQASCVICPAGSYCDVSGLSAHIDCATAYSTNYCPEGSIYPGKCPIGTYVNSDQTACEPCGAGRYCWPDTGDIGDIGDCEYTEGFLCRSGAWSPKPLISGLEFIQVGSNAFYNYNGPVLGGYYSEALGVATACAIGTFQPSYYSQSCIDCYRGHYCPKTGMSSIADFRCAAGYYCELASEKEQPVGETYGDICPVGRECGYTLVHPMFCPDGFISESEGLAQCTTCPIGYYCDIYEESTDPAVPYECITQSSCTGGEKRQPICPSGTFHNTGEEYCQKCIAGHYCRAGIIAEQCAAGYICEVDDYYSQPDPAGTECEAGKYCPMGTLVSIWCPFETQSTATRAMQVTDCVACQPGYLCEFGQRNATECPPGHYCPPKADDLIYKGELYECPVGTYNPWTKKIYAFDCQDCEAGYYCNVTALVNVTGKECPPGHYCPPKTIQPNPCPPGTYIDYFGASEEESCEGCTLGFYCPEGTSAPIECEDGYSCPFYASTMQTCRGGYYCNADTRYQEQDCPVNFYCPRGTGYPIPCDLKHVCEARTEWQVFCANGYYVLEQTIPGLANQCKKCPAGTYSISTIDGCAPCPAGYLCYGGTNTDRPKDELYDFGTICGKGQYCPEGSYSPEFCPPGTYNPNFGAKSLEQCILCPEGSSNAAYGAEGCSPCGQFATAPEGSTQCSCIGDNRVYSNADNSCRCKSGYDYKNTDGTSEGSLSDTTDCIPLVFDRCEGEQVRDPSGACVNKFDCLDVCGEVNGVRDDVLGVCTCNQQPNIDEICNQDCRSKAPTYKYISATKMNMTKDGVTTTIDLSDGREVFGNASSATGKVRTVQMNGKGGFTGTYSAPEALLPKNKTSIVEEVNGNFGTNITTPFSNSTTRAKQTELVVEEETQSKKTRRNRKLQTAPVTSAEQIPNPQYCINTDDTFLFTIESPSQYPKYMKDSVMNSNLQFDYGAFIELESEMTRKQAQGDITPSVFTFTFTQSGNYVFQDASDPSQLLIITVKGLGESCADPDRYLEIISGENLAQNGIANRNDIIIQPNYPLIISMLGLLLFGTAFTMWMVSYCMRKGWTIKELKDDSYRSSYLGLNIHHQNHKLFRDKNDFVKYKSNLMTYEEDDLDGVNMDLQQDIVDTGKGYLRTYNRRRNKHKRDKLRKRREVDALMQEVEALVNVLNSDSTAAQMHWLDIDVLNEETNENIDDNKIKAQIEKQMAALVRQEEHQLDQYKQKKDELLKAASELEKERYQRAHDNMIAMETEMVKKMNQVDDMNQIGNETFGNGFAIYDNGDVKSKNNMIVRLIETNAALNDDDKERMLQEHESQIHQIDNILDVQKRKQENELDRVLKERLDRRHRQREKTYGKKMREEQREVETRVQSEFDLLRAQELERIQRDHEDAVTNIMTNQDVAIQRQQLQDLEELTEQKKRQVIIDLSNEQDRQIDSQKLEISKHHMQGLQNEEELANEMQKLMGQNNEVARRMIAQAETDRSNQESALTQKIAKQQLETKKRLETTTQQEIDVIEQLDVIAEHEKESMSIEASLKLKIKAMLMEGGKDSVVSSSFGLDRNGTPINDPSAVKAADVARKDCAERKLEMAEKLYKMGKEIDIEIDRTSLFNQLAEHDASLASQLKQQQDMQDAKLEARRKQLKSRKIAKIKDDQHETLLRSKILGEEDRQQESRKITEEYVRKLFKNVPKRETAEQKHHKAEILNEYLCDEIMDQLSALLAKQYMESDVLLKNCVYKYIQMDVREETAIKEQFQIDLQSLEKLRPAMTDELYTAQLKKLRVAEENMLRKQDLMVKREHAEEEARIRKELDRKHLSEQVELRMSLSQQHTQLRLQLIGEETLQDPEYEHERKALERYQQMKHTETERRIRQIELQKKTYINQYEADMKAMFEDYEDMMRQKHKQKRLNEEQEMSIRKRIQERKERVRKNNIDEGLTKEEQEAMIKNYQTQLEMLDSAYTAEQRRQQLIMRAKLENRKNRMIKVQQLKKEMDKKPLEPFTSKLSKAFAHALKNQMVSTDNDYADDDSELLQRLRDWKQHRGEYETRNFISKAAGVGLDGLDENQVKIMVIKLQQIEKLLKEFARKRQQKIKEKELRSGRRRSSVSSTGSQFMNRLGNKLVNQNSSTVAPMITEGDEGQESDEELLAEKKPAKSILKTNKTINQFTRSFNEKGGSSYKPSASFTNARI